MWLLQSKGLWLLSQVTAVSKLSESLEGNSIFTVLYMYPTCIPPQWTSELNLSELIALQTGTFSTTGWKLFFYSQRDQMKEKNIDGKKRSSLLIPSQQWFTTSVLGYISVYQMFCRQLTNFLECNWSKDYLPQRIFVELSIPVMYTDKHNQMLFWQMAKGT